MAALYRNRRERKIKSTKIPTKTKPRWRIYRGDMRQVLRRRHKLGHKLFDAVVTDPPYNLASIGKRFGKKNAAPVKVKEFFNGEKTKGSSPYLRSSAGFMNQVWDDRIAFEVKTWQRVFNCLKPGAFLLAFSGRNYHRMVCAIEDAGFNIITHIDWINGQCVDQDTKILTQNGWKSYKTINKKDKVATWNHITNEIKLQKINAIHIMPYKGDMVVFKNHNTNQLVTPNHRIYKQHWIRTQINGNRKGEFEPWTIMEAGAINRYLPIKLPIAAKYNGSGIGKWQTRLLAWVWTEGGFDLSGIGVRIYQSNVNPKNIKRIRNTLNNTVEYYSEYTREREYEGRKYIEHSWFFTGPWAEYIRVRLPNKHPTWNLLWQMSFQERKTFIKTAMHGDGCWSSLQFFQKNRRDLKWFQTLLHTTNMQGMIGGHSRKDCISLHNNPTTMLVSKTLKNHKQFYDGMVWCVSVDNGAFLAKRNGQIFITGNSFPKSVNVSKFLDKHFGKRRKKQRIPAHLLKNPPNLVGGADGRGNDRPWQAKAIKKGYHEIDSNIAIHKIAKLYDGYGTAIKSSAELIVLAQKPREGTIVQNILKYGTGALNIDGCRIAYETTKNPATNPLYRVKNGYKTKVGSDKNGSSFSIKPKGGNVTANANGRWPSNVIHSGDDTVMQHFGLFGTRKAGSMVSNINKPKTNKVYGKYNKTLPFGGYGDDGSVARFFYCAKVKASDRVFYCTICTKSFLHVEKKQHRHRRQGGKKNFSHLNYHPTVKPELLMSYLIKMVRTPYKNCRILDPFAGTGTTAIAALKLGCRVTCIEQHSNYVSMIKRRVRQAGF
jgi:DNA modification methylase